MKLVISRPRDEDPLQLMHYLGAIAGRVAPKKALSLDIRHQWYHPLVIRRLCSKTLVSDKGDLSLKYLSVILLGTAVCFDRKLDHALREAKDILLVVSGGNILHHHHCEKTGFKRLDGTAKQKVSDRNAETTYQAIEDVVAKVDLASIEEAEEAAPADVLRTALTNGITASSILTSGGKRQKRRGPQGGRHSRPARERS